MNKVRYQNQFRSITPAMQKGIITTFTGVLILIMLTLMMFFAMRVGVFEQRVSANDARQKMAFHAAESGIHHGKEFFLVNQALIASDQVDLLTGSGSDGWIDTPEARWQKCSEAGLNLASGHGPHPCFGEAIPAERSDLYYYSFAGSTELPVNVTAIIPGTTEEVSVEALLCVLEIDKDEAVPVRGCSTDRDVADGSYYMITLLARGEADCDATGGGNSPNVPLTTKSSFPPSGTAEVVPNPNAGGVGVPISVWMNNNTSCTGGSVFDPSSGSWATCEMHEWYGVDTKPADMACSGNCSCTQAESLSYTDATNTILGIDLVSDTNFPCDLFQFYFGIPSTSYEIVKGFSKIISDCDSLGSDSFGIYWVSGSSCNVNSNTVVGSKDHPVLLISAASLTRFNGGSKFYGVLFITDVEDANAELQSIGTNTVYGSVINDGTLGSFQGTFQVVWAEDVSEKAGNSGGLGSILGGWSDFHRDWE
jgi:hypothetical protein